MQPLLPSPPAPAGHLVNSAADCCPWPSAPPRSATSPVSQGVPGVPSGGSAQGQGRVSHKEPDIYPQPQDV